MKYFKSISVILLAVISFSQLSAQQVVATAGGDYKTDIGSISWTIGELAIETIQSQDLILTQGFHQTRLTVTGIDLPGLDPDISVFPNPTADLVNVKLGDVGNPADWSLYLFDQNGKKLVEKRLASDKTDISLGSYPTAIYYVRLEGKDRQAKVFRIVKK